MLKVWGRRSAFNVQKVLWLIGELGLEHEHIPAGGHFGGLRDPQFLALNPHGRVPVLQDGALAVWQSRAILRYLAARYGGGAFWAADPGARWRADIPRPSLPNVDAWYRRLQQRPAYREHVMVPFGELQGRLDD